MHVFFFGHGYSSAASAHALHTLVDPTAMISGTTRLPEGAARLAASGLHAHVFDGAGPGPTIDADLAKATHLVQSIPPQDGIDPVLHWHAEALAASRSLEWVCYYSTVGVYGDFGGAWIDETAPCRPQSPRALARVRIEAEWRDFAQRLGVPLLILRLAGIYGPGRSSFDKLREGTARRIVKPGQVFNRIHVEDIGRVTALAAKAKLSGTFNLSDDEPAPPQDLIADAARRMGVPAPEAIPFENAELNAMQRSFYSDNKRVSNRAIREALGIDLLYPTYREGLAAIDPGVSP